jgi:hypothetical protein
MIDKKPGLVWSYEKIDLAMKSLLPALPVTMRPTSKIHYFARSVK